MSEATSSENPFAGQGSVLLDIGGDVGALVVTMPAAMEGVEVEIRPESGHQHDHSPDQEHHHDHAHHPHVAVVNRPVEGSQIPSLVFPELLEGHYELYVKGTRDVRLSVDVA
ncbi:MAG: hypothetical protein ABI873_18965, partial [Marmoricola sp.]